MAQKYKLIRAAANLRGSAFEEWNAFIVELQRYSQEVSLELVRATIEQLPTAQGRAQGVEMLTRDLTTAHTDVERMEKSK